MGLALAVLTLSAACGGGGEAPATSTLPPIGQGGRPQPQPPPRFTLAGLVLNSLGNPVPQAAVLLGGREAVTDERGRFEISQVPAGLYELTVQAPGEPILVQRISFSGEGDFLTLTLPDPQGEGLFPTALEPPLLSQDTSLNTDLTITFSQPLAPDPELSARVSLVPGGAPFQVRVEGNRLVIVPRRQFPAGSRVSLRIEPPLTSQGGEELSVALTAAFRTVEVDREPPRLLGVEPDPAAGPLPLNPTLRLVLNEPPATLPTLSSEPPHQWQAAVEGTDLVITPAAPLTPLTSYTLTITGIEDQAGNRLAPVVVEFATSDRTQSFTIRDPAWNPITGEVVFAANPEGQFDLFSADPESGQVRRLFLTPWDELSPTVSLDGQLIAYHSLRQGNRDIYLRTLTGGEEVRLTEDPADDRDPDFSRITQRLFFVSDRGSTTPQRRLFRLWEMNFDGGGKLPLTTGVASSVFDPTHLPFTDQQLVLLTPVEGRMRVMNVALGEEPLVVGVSTLVAGTHSSPTVSGSGDRVAFVASLSGEPPQVWTANLDGSFPARLTDLPLGVSQVAFSPFPGDPRLAAVLPRSDGGSDLALLDGDTGEIITLLVRGSDVLPLP